MKISAVADVVLLHQLVEMILAVAILSLLQSSTLTAVALHGGP